VGASTSHNPVGSLSSSKSQFIESEALFLITHVPIQETARKKSIGKVASWDMHIWAARKGETPQCTYVRRKIKPEWASETGGN
jgi:hypothetical protein